MPASATCNAPFSRCQSLAVDSDVLIVVFLTGVRQFTPAGAKKNRRGRTP
jgi:hypothetical protein